MELVFFRDILIQSWLKYQIHVNFRLKKNKLVLFQTREKLGFFKKQTYYPKFLVPLCLAPNLVLCLTSDIGIRTNFVIKIFVNPIIKCKTQTKIPFI